MFAFICYTTKGGVLKAIAEMNPLRLRGKNIFVGEARYRRKAKPAHKPLRPGGVDLQQHTAQKTHKEVVPIDAVPDGHASRAEKDRKDPHGNGWTKKVKVEVAKENFEWLQRSLVGGTTKPFNFESLKEVVGKNLPNLVQVREMGAYKALLPFDSAIHAEEAYTLNMNDLLRLFHSVWRWEESEYTETRRVWLECFGVALHAWSAETFTTIEGQWGEVVSCDRETELCNSFAVGRI
ncbi:hypothetical protein AAHE18_09G079600 [Arachis hypogaea]